MPQGGRAFRETRAEQQADGQHDGGPDRQADEQRHRRSLLAFLASSSMRAFFTRSSIRARSSSDTRDASPPSSAATAFVVEPSKKVSTRCFRADRRAECRGTVGT